MESNVWSDFELEEIIEIKKDKYNPKKESENYQCIELEHINQVTGTINGYTSAKEQSSIKNKFYKGQVLYGKLRPYLRKYYLCKFDGVCSSEIWVLNGKKVKNEYLFYLIQDDKFNNIANVSTGSKMPRADWNFMKEYPFTIPPKLEQQKIAQILSTWDLAIEKKEQLIEKKKEFKKGLMQRLLSGKVRFKEFNDKWIEVKLGDVFKERKDIGYNNLELLAITTANGVVRRTEVDIKDSSSEDKSKYKRILPGDIGYNTMRMWQGVSGLSKYEGIVSPAYTILKPTNKINSEYMSYLFKRPSIINLFYRYSQGLVSDTLNLKYENFKEIKVYIPQSVKEQEKIAKVLIESDKEIELLQKQLEKFKLQKKGLMQRLLTGEVRVKVN